MRRWLRYLSPVRAIFLAFTAATWIGILLLCLPIAKRGPGGATFMEAFFTATSAICVTGLTIVDTATFWTPFGQAVILGLIQLGGFGVMTLATVIGLTILGRLSLRSRLTAAVEVKNDSLENIGHVVRRVILISLIIEASLALILTARFLWGYGYDIPRAIWHGTFHAVSSFNNAGFALHTTNLISFVSDPFICIPIMVGIILGGLGFPVLYQLRHHLRDRIQWSMNTRIVLVMTVVLLLIGTIYITALEWNNPGTLGPLTWDQKLLAGAFQSVQTRTAGFNSVDTGAMNGATLFGMDILMFIGGGPAGTAGGIKVTTVAVLWFIVWAEIRSEAAVNVFGKRLSRAVHRQAIAVALLAMSLVVVATIIISIASRFAVDVVLFEVISAFGTVGLSTGITADLDNTSQLVLCFLMYAGRLGPITLASALATTQRRRLYELPKERPIIG